MTVDRAFVLAGPGLSSEWAYTAMSRGRRHNALYFAAERDEARAEFAPRERDERTPLERLIAALDSSEASTLAIDTGASAIDGEIRAAEAALQDARTTRERAEAARLAWRPSMRARIDAARQAETDAIRRLAGLNERRLARSLRPQAKASEAVRAIRAAQARRAELRQERDFGIER
jgi:hypothetical protein